MKRHLLALTIAVSLGVIGTSVQAADTPSTTTTSQQESSKLATSYVALAGSPSNADALVSGLRNGTSIALITPATATSPAVQTTFTPDTGKLGYGNVNIALALAQAELTKAGITQPTAAQLEAALNGGAVTTTTGAVQFPGVLALRAKGEGWGQIAHTLGFKVGEIVSAAKAKGPVPDRDDIAHGGKGDKDAKADKAEKLADKAADKADKAADKTADKAERAADKAEKVDKPDKVTKVDRPDKPQRPDKPDRPDKPEHGGR